jgi:hypothetical protein
MFNFWAGYGTVYDFHKPLRGLFSANCHKPGYIIYPVPILNIFLKWYLLLEDHNQ